MAGAPTLSPGGENPAADAPRRRPCTAEGGTSPSAQLCLCCGRKCHEKALFTPFSAL